METLKLSSSIRAEISWKLRSGELLGQRFRGSGNRFGDNLVLGVEVPVEAAVSEACGCHQIGKARPSDSILAERPPP